MTETKRIRWQDEPENSIFAITGRVGTLVPAVFHIYAPWLPVDEWVLTSSLPHWKFRTTADNSDKLKDDAERWLEEFISSLVAVFEDDIWPPPTRMTSGNKAQGA